MIKKIILLISISSNLICKNNLNSFNPIIVGSTDSEDGFSYEPVSFTSSGIESFFKFRYNHPKYASEYIPNSFNDLIQFLEYAQANNQNKKFVNTVFKIFQQKIKSAEYININEFTKFLKILPNLIAHYFIINKNEQENEIKEILYNEFLNNYQSFREDPNKFLEDLSKKICSSVLNKNKTDDVSLIELQNTIIRFLETTLSKILWSTESNFWVDYKELNQNIFELKNLFKDSNDINDLICSANARLNYFIDLIGSEIPQDLYENAINEIESDQLPWLAIEEYDELINPKKNELLYTLKTIGLIKAIARNKLGYVEID